ncbi:hypothetical protein BSKO_01198 [Bryopsis sp. KO-2023]|nr:hypothetical protein BSKO_01198 [Bryopsis sp. KO-2023]
MDAYEVLTFEDLLNGMAGQRERQAAQEWQQRHLSSLNGKETRAGGQHSFVFKDVNSDMRVGTAHRKQTRSLQGRKFEGDRKRLREGDSPTISHHQADRSEGRADVGMNAPERKVAGIAPPREGFSASGSLPDGWTMELRKRKTGSKSGAFDRFYYAPDGRQFRSYVGAVRYCELQSKLEAQAMMTSLDNPVST